MFKAGIDRLREGFKVRSSAEPTSISNLSLLANEPKRDAFPVELNKKGIYSFQYSTL